MNQKRPQKWEEVKDTLLGLLRTHQTHTQVDNQVELLDLKLLA